MEKSAFISALRECFTEKEVDRLSARAIRSGLDEDMVMSAADRRLRALILYDMDAMPWIGTGDYPPNYTHA